MRVIELFAGIGACSKALANLGIEHEILDAVEIDKYAIASFNAIHGTNFEPQDITQWDKDFENVDLIMHGSPCQDFSAAGLQAGGDKDSGTRSSLMWETIRIVKKIKPKYVIWENVKNLLSKNHKHNFEAYLEVMQSLGYSNYYQILNAKDYGIPQNRERVFTVSILGEQTYEFPGALEEVNLQDFLEENANIKNLPYCEKAFNEEYDKIINSDKNIYQCNVKSGFQDCRVGIKMSPTIRASNHNTHVLQRFEFPQKQPLQLKLRDVLEENVDKKYYLSEDKIYSISHWKAYQKPFEKVQGKNSICPTLTARGAGEEHSGMITYCEELEETTNLQEECLDIRNATKKKCADGVCISGIKVIGNYMPSGHDASRIVDSNGVAPTVKENHGTVTAILETTNLQEEDCNIKTNNNITKVQNTKEMIKEVIENCASKSELLTILNKITCDLTEDLEYEDFLESQSQPNNGHKELKIRKLTPKECWRLMGFDDGDFEKAAQINSNTQLYKQAGNSIVVDVLEAILSKLLLDQ